MPPRADAVAVLRRADQSWFEHVADQYALACGVAFSCPQYPQLADGNQVREVVLAEAGDLEAAFACVEAFYADAGLTCFGWTPAEGQPVEPLAAFLPARGFAPHSRRALRLTRWPTLVPPADLRIVPLRAVRSALQTVYGEAVGGAGAHADQQVAAMNDRLDDPTFDLSVALVDHQPAGIMGLHQVGEIGCIRVAYTREGHRNRGVGTALLAHLLALAQRLALPHICVAVDTDNDAALRFFTRAGFEPGGELVTFRRSR